MSSPNRHTQNASDEPFEIIEHLGSGGFAHTYKARVLDEDLREDFEALVGDGSLSGAQRGCVLRPSGLAPDGMLGVVLHFAGHLQRADDDGGDHLQSEALLALCRLRSS